MATTLDVYEGSNLFIPLTKYAYVLCINDTSAFMVKRTQPDTKDELHLSLLDAISPNGALAVMNVIRRGFEHTESRSGAPREYETLVVQTLDPVGTVIQATEYKEAYVSHANFGDLTEDGQNPDVINITIKFGAKILHY